MIRLVVVGCVLVALIFASPFLGCIYRNHEFEALVRLRIDSPDCHGTIPGRSTECCQCILAFESVRNKDGIQFLGSELKNSYDDEHRLFQVWGEGEIRSGKNSIEVRSGHIYVNRQQLPVRSTPLRVVVKRDGRLENQFCDVSW
jgi:hypothetical protein